MEIKYTLTQKYNNCKQLNFELYEVLCRYGHKFEGLQNYSDRKGKAFAVDIKEKRNQKLFIQRNTFRIRVQIIEK